MKLGDILTITGIEFTVRPFTAAEHQAFDELAEQHQLARKAAEAQALLTARGGTARETLLRGDLKRLQTKLGAYLDDTGEALRDGLTEDGRLAAFELALQVDDLSTRINELQEERSVEALLREEELMQARETVITTFMHQVLGSPMSLAEFTAALTPAEIVLLDEVVALGKLRTGLSASTRRQSAAWERQIETLQALANQRGVGSGSASQPQPQAAPAKPGQAGRSRRSSSRSKGGD